MFYNFVEIRVDKAMKYTTEEKENLFKRLIQCLESGMTVRDALAQTDTPGRGSLYRWLEQDESMRERFARANEVSDEVLFDEALQIARTPLLETIEEEGATDTGSFHKTTKRDNVQRSKLIIYTIEQRLARRNPRKYGTKIDITSDNEKIALPVITGMVIKNQTEEELPNDADLL